MPFFHPKMKRYPFLLSFTQFDKSDIQLSLIIYFKFFINVASTKQYYDRTITAASGWEGTV